MPEEVKKPEPKKRLTLEQAIKNGDAVLKSEVETMIAEELAKRLTSLREEIRSEITKENAMSAVTASTKGAQSFLTASGLGDIKFAQRLMGLNMTPRMATFLRDEHMRLKDAQLWEYVRNQMHTASLTAEIKTTSTIGT